jgi:hypothetical protein
MNVEPVADLAGGPRSLDRVDVTISSIKRISPCARVSENAKGGDGRGVFRSHGAASGEGLDHHPVVAGRRP